MSVDGKLQDFEEIKQLKARYIRYGDTKQWSALGPLLTEDFEAIFEIAPRFSKDQPARAELKGRDLFIRTWETALVNVTTMHQVYLPEIVVTGAEATGIWAFHDLVRMPNCIFEGWGHYHDVYVKDGGAWKIKSSRVTRLHVEETWR